MVSRPRLPSWVRHTRTAWFVVEGAVLAVFGLGLSLVGRAVDPSISVLGVLAILVGGITVAIGTVVYGVLVVRADTS